MNDDGDGISLGADLTGFLFKKFF